MTSRLDKVPDPYQTRATDKSHLGQALCMIAVCIVAATVAWTWTFWRDTPPEPEAPPPVVATDELVPGFAVVRSTCIQKDARGGCLVFDMRIAEGWRLDTNTFIDRGGRTALRFRRVEQ